MTRKIKKKTARPMILLELILAIAIIGISSSVIIGSPAKVYEKQLSMLYELELERESNNFFADLLIDFKNKHPFETLSKQRISYPYKELQIHLKDYAQQTFTLSYKLWVRSEKESNNQTFYKLLGCQLCFDKSSSLVSFNKKPLFFTLLIRQSPQREEKPIV